MKNNGLNIFIAIVVLVVVSSIIASLVFIGSPQKERLRRFDGQKASSLWSVEREIVRYWEENKTVPENLSAIEESLYLPSELEDPQSGERYEYSKVNDNEYEVCAEFNFESEESARYGRPKSEYYVRTADYNDYRPGINCFTVTFDPQAYQDILDGKDVRQLIDPVIAY